MSPVVTPSSEASVLPITPWSESSLGHLPSSCHHERMPSTPTTVVSPVELLRCLLNHVPTTGTLVPFTVAWMLSCGAKLVMLNDQKIVLILAASDSFRKAVGSLVDVAPPDSVLYRSETTASALGCTVMFEP